MSDSDSLIQRLCDQDEPAAFESKRVSVSSKHSIPVLPARAGNVEQLAARIEKSVLIVIAQ